MDDKEVCAECQEWKLKYDELHRVAQERIRELHEVIADKGTPPTETEGGGGPLFL